MVKQSVDKSSYKIAFVALIVTAVVIGSIIYFNPTLFRSSASTSTVSTSSSNTILQTVTVRLLLHKGLITIGDTTYSYMEWNDSTPNTFTFNNVTFTLQANTNVTYSGGNCYPTYGKYIVTFPDGSSQSLSTCLSAGPNPPSAIYFISHKNPQAGLLISAVNGAVYFLVSI
ncbi:MAG: hypothetical protein ABSB40_00990 [Nitrososphaeria archaeon]|jgi:hypothetical protein